MRASTVPPRAQWRTYSARSSMGRSARWRCRARAWPASATRRRRWLTQTPPDEPRRICCGSRGSFEEALELYRKGDALVGDLGLTSSGASCIRLAGRGRQARARPLRGGASRPYASRRRLEALGETSFPIDDRRSRISESLYALGETGGGRAVAIEGEELGAARGPRQLRARTRPSARRFAADAATGRRAERLAAEALALRAALPISRDARAQRQGRSHTSARSAGTPRRRARAARASASRPSRASATSSKPSGLGRYWYSFECQAWR